MFRGRSRHTLDSKGRLAIPARFKAAVEQKADNYLVVTRYGECLWAFARPDWRVLEEKAANLPLFDKAGITFLRYFISGAVECPIKQGRITIPLNLREEAGLNKEVLVAGELKKFEIWDMERWEKKSSEDEEIFPEVSLSLPELRI